MTLESSKWILIFGSRLSVLSNSLRCEYFIKHILFASSSFLLYIINICCIMFFTAPTFKTDTCSSVIFYHLFKNRRKVIFRSFLTRRLGAMLVKNAKIFSCPCMKCFYMVRCNKENMEVTKFQIAAVSLIHDAINKIQISVTKMVHIIYSRDDRLKED